MKILDTHCHWFDLEKYGKTWYKGWPAESDVKLRKTYLPKHYYDEQNVIETAIHVQVAHEFDENLWVKNLSDDREKGCGAMVGWLDLTSNEAVFDKQLGQLQAAPGERQLVALRHVAEAEANADWLANPSVAVNLKKSQLPFDLLIRTRNLKAAAILVEQCPNVTFVVDHMAKPDVSGEEWKDEEEWKNGMKQLATLKNVHCKVSGFYSADPTASFTPDQNRVNHFVSIVYGLFGPERLMWGSDWPVSLGLNDTPLVQNIESYKTALEKCTKSNEELEAIFYSNGAKFYKLNF